MDLVRRKDQDLAGTHLVQNGRLGPPDDRHGSGKVDNFEHRGCAFGLGYRDGSRHNDVDPGTVPGLCRTARTSHGENLTRLLADNAEVPDEGGSIMGTVNRIVVATRALFDEIDVDVLTQIHLGERHVVEANEAAADADLPDPAREKMAAMLVELREILVDTRPS